MSTTSVSLLANSEPIPRRRPLEVGSHDVPWEESGPGLLIKPLWADPPTRRRAFMARLAPGTSLPAHRHLGDELTFVIEGEVTDESGTLTAGQASYRPDECVHSLSTEHGTTALIVVTGGMELVGANETGPGSLPIDIGRIPWVVAGDGLSEKPIWMDESELRSMRLLRFEPGTRLPRHRHSGDALLFGIEGETADDAGATRPGYLCYLPDGYVHSLHARHGATMLYYSWGTTDPVDGHASA
jgi:anti-sigma factor ChrR (cupin superfamily)